MKEQILAIITRKDFADPSIRESAAIQILLLMCSKEVEWALKEYHTVSDHHIPVMVRLFQDQYPAGWVESFVKAKIENIPVAILPDYIQYQEALQYPKTLDEVYSHTPGVKKISKERERQILREGFVPIRDRQYTDNQLVNAAVSYLQARDWASALGSEEAPPYWPWDAKWYKPSPENRVRELEKAGALIAAEIDRLLLNQQKPFPNFEITDSCAPGPVDEVPKLYLMEDKVLLQDAEVSADAKEFNNDKCKQRYFTGYMDGYCCCRAAVERFFKINTSLKKHFHGAD